MEKEFYNCEYCFKEFEPKRRRVQKFCSNTCRSKAHHAKKSSKDLVALNEQTVDSLEIEKQNISKVDKMSFAGVGNATAGSLAADGLKRVFTAPQNMPATKADIANMEAKLKRYHKVANLPPNQLGKTPYFDIETNEIVYSFFPL
ncbi:hypothetical protein [Xanthomarina sp. GH4-25]|uniref:hypothetical protein n=1 Tax=Xanthomarina sp. GH4-25 TaxID=3349335 RepID=UPI003878006F